MIPEKRAFCTNGLRFKCHFKTHDGAFCLPFMDFLRTYLGSFWEGNPNRCKGCYIIGRGNRQNQGQGFWPASCYGLLGCRIGTFCRTLVSILLSARLCNPILYRFFSWSMCGSDIIPSCLLYTSPSPRDGLLSR